MNDSLRGELTAWLEFYRELGIEDFYRRAPGSGPDNLPRLPAFRSGARETERTLSPAELPAAPPPSEPRVQTREGAIERSLRTSASPVPQVPQQPPVLPRTPAHALSLFDAPAPVRTGRETLEEIRAELGDCRRCKLAGGRKHLVFGQGNPSAALVFVGEGPGADEDEQGLPFVGRAGQLLNRMLQFVGIKREDVYICNVVKCRPPGNRTPEPDEVATCSPFLFRQIEAIRPRLICCLGAPAVKTVLGLKEGILKIRGNFLDYGSAKAIATVHPAYVLRNPREEKLLREDFAKIRDFLKVRGR